MCVNDFGGGNRCVSRSKLKAAGERDEDRCAEGIGHLPVKMMTVLHTAPRLS